MRFAWSFQQKISTLLKQKRQDKPNRIAHRVELPTSNQPLAIRELHMGIALRVKPPLSIAALVNKKDKPRQTNLRFAESFPPSWVSNIRAEEKLPQQMAQRLRTLPVRKIITTVGWSPRGRRLAQAPSMLQHRCRFFAPEVWRRSLKH